MNWIAITILIGVLIALGKLRPPILLWVLVWPVAVWSFVRLGISPPVPHKVLVLYLSLTMVGITAYILADQTRSRTVSEQLRKFIVERKNAPLLYLVMVLIPVGVAGSIYIDMHAEVKAPTFARTIHPAPPNEISFKGKQIDLIAANNPYRALEKSDPDQFAEHVNAGKKLYYQNCVFCHGDNLSGDGIYAHGFEPIPANFNNPTTIAMQQESYLFWRIAKGGPGLPEESGPWSSAMPAWEKFFSEDDIWNVILFLYDYIGRKPREREETH